jgi:hypothetical protein
VFLGEIVDLERIRSIAERAARSHGLEIFDGGQFAGDLMHPPVLPEHPLDGGARHDAGEGAHGERIERR